jgi:hypothetical protein
MTTNQNMTWLQQGGAAMVLATGLPASLEDMIVPVRVDDSPQMEWLRQGAAAMVLATGLPPELEKMLIQPAGSSPSADPGR